MSAAPDPKHKRANRNNATRTGADVPARLDIAAPAGGEPFDYQALFEQYAATDPRGLLLIGSRRRLLAINEAARQMLAFDREVGIPIADVAWGQEVAFLAGEVFHDRRSVSHEAYVPDPDRLVRFTLLPVVSASGEPYLVLVMVEDVSRLRHLETVRRDFVANVSHELRTPIASINLLVETLQRGALQDPDAANHFLHRIEVETMAMARLVEELLELSRLEKGVMSLNLSPVAAQSLLEDVINRLTPTAEEKQLAIRIDVQPDLPDVLADAKRIEQVLLNLVHNAIKFTPTGGLVTLRAARHGRGVQMEITDTGVGMEAADTRRIFERFYKVDKGRSRSEGSGLGLAIARHLLELHGTQLHVVSEVGRGSRFSFSLPVAG